MSFDRFVNEFIKGVHRWLISLRGFVPDAISSTALKGKTPLPFDNIPARSANWAVEVHSANS